MQENTATIGAAIPEPSRPFETFPSPEEIAGTRLRMAGFSYLQQHCGVSPADDTAWATYCAQDHFGALCWGLLALLNQHEVARGLPLRWARETVFDLPPETLMRYYTVARASVGGETSEAPADTRPTAVPGPRKRGRASARTRHSIGPSSPTESTTSTGGDPATS